MTSKALLKVGLGAVLSIVVIAAGIILALAVMFYLARIGIL